MADQQVMDSNTGLGFSMAKKGTVLNSMIPQFYENLCRGLFKGEVHPDLFGAVTYQNYKPRMIFQSPFVKHFLGTPFLRGCMANVIKYNVNNK